MNVTAIQIWPTRDGMSRLKARVSITLANALRVNDLRIIEGSQGPFVMWPSERKVGTDQWVQLVHPLERATLERMNKAILEEYANTPK